MPELNHQVNRKAAENYSPDLTSVLPLTNLSPSGAVQLCCISFVSLKSVLVDVGRWRNEIGNDFQVPL